MSTAPLIVAAVLLVVLAVAALALGIADARRDIDRAHLVLGPQPDEEDPDA